MATTPEWGPPVTAAEARLLGAYRAELLRWNRQINLLSRRDPEGTATALIRQCAGAFARWWEASGAALVGAAPVSPLRLFDLGSGGGLPAFVWLTLLAGRGVAVRATLVEPRHKRAWFLERLRGLPGAPAFDVVAAPWGPEMPAVPGGAGGPEPASPTPILFTIKALRLQEAAVLTPLAAALGGAASAAGRTVEIVRFQPATDVAAAALAADLALSAAGAAVVLGGVSFRADGCALLTPPPVAASAGDDAGLFVSRHRIAG